MKKKMMSLALAVVMCLSLCVPAFATDNINGTVQPEIRATVADENGNVISSVTHEADSDYIVEIYLGGRTRTGSERGGTANVKTTPVPVLQSIFARPRAAFQ
ncbi:hypothetical protein [Oscillibacter sp.]|uniref:hypothetical protein n=1 Tax=Oscillibacter sp. TaxID=1945593 RepID=UPI002897F995|nr:hypothetical protein [Oscillibacter sp.]